MESCQKFLILKLIFVLFLSVSHISCSSDEAPFTDQDQESQGRLSIYTNIPPQAYIVKRIAGEKADVKTLVSPGDDPHTFSPSPRQIMDLGKADIYFHGIMPFGRRLAETIADSSPGLRIVDITEGIRFREIEEHSPHHEHHGEHSSDNNGHGHAHDYTENDSDHKKNHHHDCGEGKDPHVWLSPPEIKIQARIIADTLIDIDPQNNDYYNNNLKQFSDELDETHATLTEILGPYKGRTFYVYHPAFGYLARTYGLKQEAVETGGRSPSARHLRTLIKQARSENVRVIFVQPQFEARSAQAIAEEIDGAVIRLDPLKEDILDNLMHIADQIESTLGENN